MRLGWKVLIPVTLVWICGDWRRVRFYTPFAGFIQLTLRQASSTDIMGIDIKQLYQDLLGLQLNCAQGTRRDRATTCSGARSPSCTRRRKTPEVSALPRQAGPASLRQRRRTLHRLQAMRSGLPRPRHHHRFRRVAKTAPVEPPAMMLTSSSASTAASARKPVR